MPWSATRRIGGPVQPLDNNSALFYTLRAIDASPNTGHGLNPRRLVFFEGKQASNPASPKAGFQPATGGGGGAGSAPDSYFDPWGKQYFVVMDTNYDNVLDVPYTDFANTSGSQQQRPAGRRRRLFAGQRQSAWQQRRHAPTKPAPPSPTTSSPGSSARRASRRLSPALGTRSRSAESQSAGVVQW